MKVTSTHGSANWEHGCSHTYYVHHPRLDLALEHDSPQQVLWGPEVEVSSKAFFRLNIFMGVFTCVCSLVCHPKELIAGSFSPSDFIRSLLRSVLLWLMQTQEGPPSTAFATLETNTQLVADMALLMVRKVTVPLEAFTTPAGVSPTRGLAGVGELCTPSGRLCTPRALSSGANSLGGRE